MGTLSFTWSGPGAENTSYEVKQNLIKRLPERGYLVHFDTTHSRQ
jgi:hypothetical protein